MSKNSNEKLEIVRLEKSKAHLCTFYMILFFNNKDTDRLKVKDRERYNMQTVDIRNLEFLYYYQTKRLYCKITGDFSKSQRVSSS